MSKQFLVFVDHDCDGVFWHAWRVDLPATMRDDDAMHKALELGQIKARINDPSEWFSATEDESPNAFATIQSVFNEHPANRTESIASYAHGKGNPFDLDRS